MGEEARLLYYRSPEAREAGIEVRLPRLADAGFDIPALEDCSIPPHSFAPVRTGLHFAIPGGFVGIVKDRSSVALRGGAISAGVIDANYRGEVKVLMHNRSDRPLAFKKGERIAQMLVIRFFPGQNSDEVDSLDALGETDRGHGGFGSTGS